MPEIGSLRALANGESQFVGSSSGVYFINTVRKAFSSSTDGIAGTEPRPAGGMTSGVDEPCPEACVVGDIEQVEDATDANRLEHGDIEYRSPGRPTQEHLSPIPTTSDFVDDMSRLPDYQIARTLVLTYFRIWHPAVPFLQGPECMAELSALYATEASTCRTAVSLIRLVTFRCIFNIALLDVDDLPDVGSVKIRSGTELFPVLSLLALRSDAKSIQALLAAQVYFVSVMSLRHASSVGGLVSKAIYQAGMHRCPVRYAHLSPDECAMRKRIFWSFYVLDRFVSQSLGHPNGIQDSDIDVCSPGRPDLHEPVVQSTRSDSGTAADATILHLPVNHPDRISVTPDQQGREDPEDEQEEEVQDSEKHATCSNGEASARAVAIHRHRQETQSVLEHHVRHSQLVGRILDVFHKSIHARDMKNRTILFLKADIAAWGNDLSRPRLGTDTASVPALSPDPTVFPYITHQYTILLLNRPLLSFDSRSADFQAAIQTCIGTANTIITAIEQYATSGGPLFWPGYMSAVWMSGLVLALSARLKVYSIAKATRGIRIVLGILSRMEKRWRTARDCRAVLSMLLENIESPRRQQKRRRSDAGDDESVVDILRETTQATDSRPRTSKRRATHHLNLESQSGTKVDAPPVEGGNVHTPSKTRTPVVNFMKRSMDLDFGAPKEPLPRHSSHQNGYSIFTQSDLNSFSAPFLQETDLNMGAYFSPIPTTFPDRNRNPLTQQTDLFGNDYSTFDIFDGATWGSLLDIVNDAGGTTEP
ncbi:putative transcriptional regulatory protein [Colletotrichum sidae]|uniref:Putative transcriptional regulatory protein n=1 Tax=Colletotrichum sidae TaxID=1347389 RepID=A0A4R8TR59_9PEZI|nr:putative transcriptional regulatory protein [Colletotrichum sidae]